MKTPAKSAMTTIALLCLLASAYAADAPAIKEGYWTVHTITTDNPGNSVSEGKYSICRSHAFDHFLDTRPKPAGCTTKADSFQGKQHIVEMVCKLGPTVLTNRDVSTYVSGTSIHSESNATYNPALEGHTSEKLVMDFTYAGACPANIQPGDRVNQNGLVMHLWKH
jgi:hypothetical protein